jgi:hypothetical protein
MPISPGHDDEHVDGAAAGAEVGTQPVVEHHPCAAERPGHRLTLAWRRVEAVVVPELHLARSPGFATRYRACGYAARHLENTEEITRAVCADSGFVLAELNGDSDHVHLLANLPPQCRYPGW